MPVADALSRVEEYNAAIALPHDGLIGISVFTRQSGEGRRAAAPLLRSCVKLSELALRALAEEMNAAREDPHFYNAVRSIFGQRSDAYTGILKEAVSTLRQTLSYLDGNDNEAPSPELLKGTAEQLRGLATRIKEEIPRDALMASIVGTTYSGPRLR